jgi:hypothetical protein
MNMFAKRPAGGFTHGPLGIFFKKIYQTLRMGASPPQRKAFLRRKSAGEWG